MAKMVYFSQRLFHRLGILFIGALLLSSCTDFIAEINQQNNWKKQESDQVVLYYRDTHFSNAPSPDKQTVNSILANQNYYYRAIQDSIQRVFNDKVLIYLYNEDEAEEEIGTSGGGHAIPKMNTFYYTYITNRLAFTDPYGRNTPPIGAHEMVHVISHQCLGPPGTKLLSEGYAVWLDGTYAGYSIDEIIRSYQDENPGYLLSPDQLLWKEIDRESIYYPNAGMMVRYLVHHYGIEQVNQLFTVPQDDFKTEFKKITGDSWQSMSSEYDKFIRRF